MTQKYIGIVLPARLGKTGMFDQSTTVMQQVRSNFRNLILTKKGERVGQPELGCDMWKTLFEPFGEDTLDTAREAVVDAVERWLPYIELTDFQISPTISKHSVSIKCSYRLRSNPNVVDQIEIITNAINADFVTFLERDTITTQRRVVNR